MGKITDVKKLKRKVQYYENRLNNLQCAQLTDHRTIQMFQDLVHLALERLDYLNQLGGF